MMRNDELGLADYGLEYIHPEIVCHAPFLDGSYLTQYHDIERTCEQFAKFSKKDAAAYRRMIAEYDAIKPLFDAASYTPIGFGKPINDRLDRASRRQEMAAPHGAVGAGRSSATISRTITALLHAVDGVPDRDAAGMADDRAARLFAGLGPAALELVHPQGRLGRAHRKRWCG